MVEIYAKFHVLTNLILRIRHVLIDATRHEFSGVREGWRQHQLVMRVVLLLVTSSNFPDLDSRVTALWL
jgi:hypothetical protein